MSQSHRHLGVTSPGPGIPRAPSHESLNASGVLGGGTTSGPTSPMERSWRSGGGHRGGVAAGAEGGVNQQQQQRPPHPTAHHHTRTGSGSGSRVTSPIAVSGHHSPHSNSAGSPIAASRTASSNQLPSPQTTLLMPVPASQSGSPKGGNTSRLQSSSSGLFSPPLAPPLQPQVVVSPAAPAAAIPTTAGTTNSTAAGRRKSVINVPRMNSFHRTVSGQGMNFGSSVTPQHAGMRRVINDVRSNFTGLSAGGGGGNPQYYVSSSTAPGGAATGGGSQARASGSAADTLLLSAQSPRIKPTLLTTSSNPMSSIALMQGGGSGGGHQFRSEIRSPPNTALRATSNNDSSRPSILAGGVSATGTPLSAVTKSGTAVYTNNNNNGSNGGAESTKSGSSGGSMQQVDFNDPDCPFKPSPTASTGSQQQQTATQEQKTWQTHLQTGVSEGTSMVAAQPAGFVQHRHPPQQHRDPKTASTSGGGLAPQQAAPLGASSPQQQGIRPGGPGAGGASAVPAVFLLSPNAPPKATDLLKDRRRVSLRLINEACDQEGVDVGGTYKPPPMFGLFGSFERETYFQELKLLCRTSSEALPFIQACDDTLQQTLPSLALLEWINHEDRAPPESFFTMPVIAWPMETIKSLACYYVTALKVGFDRLVGFLEQGGIFASGKGIFGALAVACSGTMDDFFSHADTMIRFSITTGLMYQEHADKLEALMDGCQQRSFSLLVVNVSIPCLQLLLQHHNATSYEGHIGTSAEDNATKCTVQPRVVPFSEVQISRVISHRAAVVTGHPVDLTRFDQLLVAFGHATGVKIHRDYLPAYTPENSPFYNQMLKMELLHAWRADGLLDNKRRMYFRMPFFSPTDSREWSNSGVLSPQLFPELAQAVTCAPQDLTCSLQLLRPTDCVLEFGTSALRIGQLISWTKRSIVILAQPWDTVVQSALPSPRRSSHRKTRAATLGKAATWNTVLNSTHWSGKPNGVGCGEYTALDCSFFDLGLLLDADKVAGTANIRFGDQSITSLPPDTKFPGAGGLGTSSPGRGAIVSASASPITADLARDPDAPPFLVKSGSSSAQNHRLVPTSSSLSNTFGTLDRGQMGTMGASFSSLSQFPTMAGGANHLLNSNTGGLTSPLVFGGGSSVHALPNVAGGKAGGGGLLDDGTSTSESGFSGSRGNNSATGLGILGSQGSSQQSYVNNAGVGGAIVGGSHQFVAINSQRNNVVNVYQVAPLIRYLEMQHRATLTQGAVEVTRKLSMMSGVDFPTHTMLMCPTIFALFEYWDTLEFVVKRYEKLNQRDKEIEFTSEDDDPELHNSNQRDESAGFENAAGGSKSSSSFSELRAAHVAGGSRQVSTAFSMGGGQVSRAEQRVRQLNRVLQNMYSDPRLAGSNPNFSRSVTQYRQQQQQNTSQRGAVDRGDTAPLPNISPPVTSLGSSSGGGSAGRSLVSPPQQRGRSESPSSFRK